METPRVFWDEAGIELLTNMVGRYYFWSVRTLGNQALAEKLTVEYLRWVLTGEATPGDDGHAADDGRRGV